MATDKKFTFQHLKNANGATPTKDDITYGEIAIGYKKDNEAIFIKNTADEIVSFLPSNAFVKNVTYSELVALRDGDKLVPSTYYRITDFVTTVANDDEARSAGHVFDVIVLATDTNVLQEEGFAALHKDDTYFENCQLNAWKVWYCLDNDTERFHWADTENGKGVIYRLIDEWQNDCPYDFKNVQFKRYKVEDETKPSNEEDEPSDAEEVEESVGILKHLDGQYIGYNGEMQGLLINDKEDYIWAYTFSFGNRSSADNPNDASMLGYSTAYGSNGYFGNVQILPTALRYGGEEEIRDVFCLNNIIFFSSNQYRSEIRDCKIAAGCFNMTLNGYELYFGCDSRSIIMGRGCSSITTGEGFTMNTFGDACCHNTFGNLCKNNIFGSYNSNNTFGNVCTSNTFGEAYTSNTFSDNCNSNTFGKINSFNTFKNGCNNNVFADNCKYNVLGNACVSNVFGTNCVSNTFNNSCTNNTFGDNCSSNTFANGCLYNVFGKYTGGNIIGENCFYNSFGAACGSNTLGDGCSFNIFESECIANTFENYFKNNTLGNNVKYINISEESVQYVHILNGTMGTPVDRLEIAFEPKVNYSQYAGYDSNGTTEDNLQIWVEADSVVSVLDGGEY